MSGPGEAPDPMVEHQVLRAMPTAERAARLAAAFVFLSAQDMPLSPAQQFVIRKHMEVE